MNRKKLENEFNFHSSNETKKLPYYPLGSQKKVTSIRWWSRKILIVSVPIIFGLIQIGCKSLSEIFVANTSSSEVASGSKKFVKKNLPVETIAVERVDSYQVEKIYTGTITSRRSSELGFERGGKLIRNAVREGDEVKEGFPLAYLDVRDLKVQEREVLAQKFQAMAKLKEMQAGPRQETIAAARATVRKLKEKLELAKIKKLRRQNLHREGAISREELDEVNSETKALEATLDQAQSKLDLLIAGTRSEEIEAQQARVEQLNASLERIRLNLNKSILLAPFTGIISAQRIDEGTVVAPGQSIVRLVETKVMEARVGIPVSALPALKNSRSLQLQVENQVYPAQISAILPELESNTRTVTVILALDRAAIVVPGQVVRLKLSKTIFESGYWVPINALVKGRRGLWSCYTLGKYQNLNNSQVFKVEEKAVEVLSTTNKHAFVRGTLQTGDRLIIGGEHRLVPGQLVKTSDYSTSETSL